MNPHTRRLFLKLLALFPILRRLFAPAPEVVIDTMPDRGESLHWWDEQIDPEWTPHGVPRYRVPLNRTYNEVTILPPTLHERKAK